MEQITRDSNGDIFYGTHKCKSVDDAYHMFRTEYHIGLGRNAHKRLDRVCQRGEHVHGYGFVFSGGKQVRGGEFPVRRVRCHLMGLIGISYVRSIGVWDYADVPDDRFDDWLDTIYERGSGLLYTAGLRKSLGRRVRKRYR